MAQTETGLSFEKPRDDFPSKAPKIKKKHLKVIKNEQIQIITNLLKKY